jgi:RHS repeat-associated protein
MSGLIPADTIANRPSKSLIHSLALMCVWLFAVCTAQAQIKKIGDDTSTPIPAAGHDYIKMLSETVNPSNGSVSLRIDVPVPQGRGLTIPFSFAYDSNGVHHLYTPFGTSGATWTSNVGLLSQGGWSYSVPMASQDVTLAIPGLSSDTTCEYSVNFLFQDPKGGRHGLPLLTVVPGGPNPNPAFCPNLPVPNGGDDVFHGTIPATDVLSIYPALAISGPDGTVYSFSNLSKHSASKDVCCVTSSLPEFIEDRNGNKVTIDDLSLHGGASGAFTVTDSLGRASISSSGFGPSGATNTLSVSGLANPYQITWKTTTANFSVPSFQANAGGPFVCKPIPAVKDQQTVIQTITLPNGQQYRFFYGDDNPDPALRNPYGLLSEIDYPTGGWIKYTWKINDQLSEMADYPGILPDPQNPGGDITPRACSFRFATPVVATRQVGTGESASPIQTQSFSYTTTWGSGSGITEWGIAQFVWLQKGTTASTTDNVLNQSSMMTYTYVPAPFDPRYYSLPPDLAGAFAAQIPVEDTVQYFDWGSQLSPIRTVKKTWYDPFELKSEQTMLDDGSVSEVSYKYGPGAQITYKTESDFGPGAPGRVLRQTATSYSSFPATSLLSGAATILDRPSQVFVLDDNFFVLAATIYCYDQTTPAITSGITQHDYDNFSSTSNVRGNLTQKLDYISLAGSSDPYPVCGQKTSPTAASTTYTYDDTGQLQTTTTPMGHTTTYAYGPANGYISQTTVDAPDPLGTHGSSLAFMASSNQDFNSGLLTSTTDPNGFTTTYTYNDLLNRLTNISQPGGGNTTISYNDTSPNFSTHTTADLDGTNNLESYEYFDGLGRSIRSLQFDGTQGTPWTVTDTFYDGIGQIANVSNPYRTASPSAQRNPCGLCTTTTYDALGRMKLVVTPDGAQTQITYAGNTSTTTDQAGKTQKVTTDLLGRLTKVVENPNQVNGEASQTTSYTYNALGNLIAVSNVGQQRFFLYDTLGRLVRQRAVEENINPNLPPTNPQQDLLTGNSQWSTAYKYDANSNLISRTDARGTTINLVYDGVDREVSRSYANDPAGTPSVERFWDGKGTAATVANALERLTAVKSSVANYTYDVYSPKGQPMQFTETIAGTPFVMSYTYDLAGHLTSETYPSGRVVTYAINPGGRVSGVSGQTNSGGTLSAPAPYADSILYDPRGGLTDLRLGNNLWEHDIYDPSRLQTSEVGVGHSQGMSDLLKLNYDYGSTNNNGNLLRQIIAAPTTQAGVNMVVTQLAQYDAFNRLKAAQEVSGDVPAWQPTAIWEQDLSYDAYGNRSSMAVTSGMPTFSPAAPIDQGTNRFVVSATNGFAYDANGNLTQEPLDSSATNLNSYSYDAENRLVSVQQNGAPVATYQYDGDGRRIKRIVGSQSTTYVYSITGEMVAEYSTGPTQAAGTQYLSHDNVGSTRLITASDQTVLACYDFMPFGELIPQGFGLRSSVQCYGPPGAVAQLFAGNERDTETGLDHVGARYLDSNQGRFTTPDEKLADQDPRHPQSWNLYTYARNNPLKYVDTTGRDCIYIGQQNKDGSFDVTITAGECKSKGGIYVNGTVDANSFVYDSNGNTLDFSFTSPNGTLNVVSRELPDPGLMALKRAGQIASPVADPKNIAAFYGLSALGGLGLYAVGAFGGGELVTLGTIEVSSTSAPIVTGTNVVYQSVNAAGDVQYVGITNDVVRRGIEHGTRFAIRKIPGLSNLSRADAKAVEQVLIETFKLGKNGGQLLNKINSIAKTNPVYAQSIQRGLQILKSVKYPGF